MTKDYLSLDGLTHFFAKLINKFATKEELSAAQDDVITNEEIDIVCDSKISTESLLFDSINFKYFIDTATNKTYKLYINNGKLYMTEVE